MIIIFSLAVTILTFHAPFQQAPTMPTFDPLEQKVASFELRDETLGEALGWLNQSFDISISIEGVLPEEGTITNPKFSAKIENSTLGGVLDWLCALDTRYVWSRDGNNVNLFPRASSKDPSYFFNRILPDLHFQNVRRIADAVIAIDNQAGDRSGGVIYMGIGQTQGFAQTWTESFHDITVRQALNRVARQLGPTYGWQIGGTTKAKLIVFHYKLEGQHLKVGDQYPLKH